MQPGGGQIITARKEIHMNMIDLSSAELQDLIALIDAHLAELDENGEIE